MASEEETKLKEKYGSFKSIIAQLDNYTPSPEFWKKQSERNAKRMKKAKELELKMRPSWEHTQKVFGRLNDK